MAVGAIRKLVQQAMKEAGTKVPRLGDITSKIKKAEKKGDKAAVKKLKSAKTKIINKKKKLANRAVHLYLTDEDFKEKIELHDNLMVSGSNL